MPFRIRVTLAVLLSFLGFMIIMPLILPIAPLSDTVSAKELADEDSQFVDINGVELHYKTYGAAEAQTTFVLLHGFGSSLYTWHEVAPSLSDFGRVIVFDRPAAGLTERVLRGDWETNPYADEAQVALTLELMDELGIDEAVLVGHSSGGLLATQIALAAPERITGLVLDGATVYQNGGAPALLRPLMYSPQMNRLGPLFMRQFSGESGSSFLEAAWADADKIDGATRAAYEDSLKVENWDKALWELSKASRPPRVAAQLPDITIPTLVVTGVADAIVPPSLSERLADELPEASFVSFENCGHIPQEECPGAFMDAVTVWLEATNLE